MAEDLHPTLLRTCRILANARRLAILRHLQLNARQAAERLARETQASPPALWRHLAKLKRRRLVNQTPEGWQLAVAPPPLAQTLLTIVACGQA